MGIEHVKEYKETWNMFSHCNRPSSIGMLPLKLFLLVKNTFAAEIFESHFSYNI